jgi:hypothetical protein
MAHQFMAKLVVEMEPQRSIGLIHDIDLSTFISSSLKRESRGHGTSPYGDLRGTSV